MDAQYINTKIGGKYHRMFDGGHDPVDAWRKVEAASTEDTFVQEVMGYASAMTKDFVTTMGMPFKTMEKSTFDSMVDMLSGIPGVDREYLYDLCTTNAAELTASALSVVGLILSFKNDDRKKVGEILGTMGVSTVVSANPILGIITVVATAYAYKKQRLGASGLMVGAGMSLVSLSIFAILGLPFLVELVVVLLISRQVRKNLFENERLRDYFVSKVASVDIKEILIQLGRFPASALERIQDVIPTFGKKVC